MKRKIANIILILCAILCFSSVITAQKTDEKDSDKRKPPVIKPNEDRKPKNEKPRDKGKKPQIISEVVEARAELEF